MADVGWLVQLEQVSGRLLAVAADVVWGAVAVSEAGWVVIASALVETGAGVGLDAAEGVCGDRAEDQGEQKGCYQHLVTNYKYSKALIYALIIIISSSKTTNRSCQ